MTTNEIKPNEEITLAKGDPPIDSKESPIDIGGAIKKAKPYLIVFNGNEHYMVDCKIEGDYWLHFKNLSGKKRKIIVAHSPCVFLKRGFWGTQRFLVWYTGERAEVTHDPGATQYDLPMVENIIKGITSITDSEIPKVLAEEIKSSKGWKEYIPWFLFFFSNLAWMFYTNEIVKNIVPKPLAPLEAVIRYVF